jgi:hypothetical protein
LLRWSHSFDRRHLAEAHASIESAGPTMERQLASRSYDCVVIGAGVRLPPRRLAVFEVVINAVHRAAPGAVIAFNTRPEDSADAAARSLPAGDPHPAA